MEADLLILGAGPAAAAAALTVHQLAPQTRIALHAPRRAKRNWRAGETLAAPARQLLTELGCWPAFAAAEFPQCHGMRSAWGSDKVHENDFVFGLHGHGWHLDRARFDALLLNQVRYSEDPPSARFVIDATGRASAYAITQGARRRAVDALIAVTCSCEPTGAPPLVEAVADGWWYSGHGVIAFFSDADIVRAAALRHRAQWLEHLAAAPHTGAACNGVPIRSGPTITAAQTQQLLHMAGPGWVATGDAAMTIDPLSSQGVLQALTTGRIAGFAAYDFLHKGKDPTAKYQHVLQASFNELDRVRREFYSRETRWAAHPFWSRRLV